MSKTETTIVPSSLLSTVVFSAKISTASVIVSTPYLSNKPKVFTILRLVLTLFNVAIKISAGVPFSPRRRVGIGNAESKSENPNPCFCSLGGKSCAVASYSSSIRKLKDPTKTHIIIVPPRIADLPAYNAENKSSISTSFFSI